MSTIQTASGVVARALDLLNEKNTTVVTHDDKVNSLNEAWRDIYNEMCNTDSDFYYKDLTLTASPSDATGYPNQEYYVPLPPDCFKIRTVDYQDGYLWRPMKRFPLELRDDITSWPMYRLLGDNLWIIGTFTTAWNGLIRLRYYPPADAITTPKDLLAFGSFYTAAQLSGLSDPVYVQQQVYSGVPSVETDYDWSIYVSGGNAIVVECAQAGGTPSTLYTGASAISCLRYYKGSIYFLMGGQIYAASWGFGTSAITPAVVGAATGVTTFYIQNGVIYLSTATETDLMSVNGSGQTQVLASPTLAYLMYQGVSAYLDSTKNLHVNGSASIYQNLVALETDGIYLYGLDTSGTLHQLTVQVASPQAVLTDATVTTGLLSMAGCASARVGVQVLATGQMLAVGTDPDYAWSYPQNAVYEILSYQLGVDFARKRGDTDRMGVLTERLGQLKSRFLESFIRRDDYRKERIGNYYPVRSNW